MKLVDGIVNENTTGFVGKDGFFWWVGEVEDNEDPMELGRVKVRILGYYTNFQGGTVADLPTSALPWATVLQHTCQPGNDGQGESTGQLQAGAIVMGFFMDGETAQMPIVIGVMRVKKSNDTIGNASFAFTDQRPGFSTAPNPSAIHPAERNTNNPLQPLRQSSHNSVAYPGQTTSNPGGDGSPKNLVSAKDFPGSSVNPLKPLDPSKPFPTANGVGGPWKSLEYKLSYLIEDLANVSSSLVKIGPNKYLDISIGKYIILEDLTVKIDNYLTVIYAQVVSSMRSALGNLAKELQVEALQSDATGLPFASYNSIHEAAETILKSLCVLDANVEVYKKPHLETIDIFLAGFLEKRISEKSNLVKYSVDSIIRDIIEDAGRVIVGVGDMVKAVKETVKATNGYTIIEEWEKGIGIYELTTDIFKTTSGNLTGLMKMLLKFRASDCKRTTNGGQDLIGWFPLFGCTRCTGNELNDINKLRGKDPSSTITLYDSMFEEADPNMTTAKNYISGAYELHLGTPGRVGHITKRANGTTHSSISFNNAHLAEKQIRDQLRKAIDYEDLTDEQIENKVLEYINESTEKEGDTGALVADHVSYAGTLTQEVHGDDCKIINNDYVRNIEGDYLLKINGNCHIEVGGGFFFSAEGAPIARNRHGVLGRTDMQKHSLRFGSDVDMNVVGSKFELQGTECKLASMSTRITGSIFENSSYQQTMSGMEITMSAENSIEMVTPHILQLINIETSETPKKVTGLRTVIRGGCETILNPADLEKWKINLASTSPLYNEPITNGLFKVDALGGSINMNSGSGSPFMVATTTTTSSSSDGGINTTSTSESTSETGGGNLTLGY